MGAHDGHIDVFDMRQLEAGEMSSHVQYSARFAFGAKVIVVRSGETGHVNGVAFYRRTQMPMFFVEYTSTDGRAVESWFHDDELAELVP